MSSNRSTPGRSAAQGTGGQQPVKVPRELAGLRSTLRSPAHHPKEQAEDSGELAPSSSKPERGRAMTRGRARASAGGSAGGQAETDARPTISQAAGQGTSEAAGLSSAASAEHCTRYDTAPSSAGRSSSAHGLSPGASTTDGNGQGSTGGFSAVSIAGAKEGVPGFVSSLWSMVNEPSTNHFLCWSEDGRDIVIRDEARVTEELLPRYFNHGNSASFGRQLNFYNFKRKEGEPGESSDEEGSLGQAMLDRMTGKKRGTKTVRYRHKYFHRDHPELLAKVLRKTNHKALRQLAEQHSLKKAGGSSGAVVGGEAGDDGSSSAAGAAAYLPPFPMTSGQPTASQPQSTRPPFDVPTGAAGTGTVEQPVMPSMDQTGPSSLQAAAALGARAALLAATSVPGMMPPHVPRWPVGQGTAGSSTAYPSAATAMPSTGSAGAHWYNPVAASGVSAAVPVSSASGEGRAVRQLPWTQRTAGASAQIAGSSAASAGRKRKAEHSNLPFVVPYQATRALHEPAVEGTFPLPIGPSPRTEGQQASAASMMYEEGVHMGGVANGRGRQGPVQLPLAARVGPGVFRPIVVDSSFYEPGQAPTTHRQLAYTIMTDVHCPIAPQAPLHMAAGQASGEGVVALQPHHAYHGPLMPEGAQQEAAEGYGYGGYEYDTSTEDEDEDEYDDDDNAILAAYAQARSDSGDASDGDDIDDEYEYEDEDAGASSNGNEDGDVTSSTGAGMGVSFTVGGEETPSEASGPHALSQLEKNRPGPRIGRPPARGPLSRPASASAHQNAAGAASSSSAAALPYSGLPPMSLPPLVQPAKKRSAKRQRRAPSHLMVDTQAGRDGMTSRLGEGLPRLRPDLDADEAMEAAVAHPGPAVAGLRSPSPRSLLSPHLQFAIRQQSGYLGTDVPRQAGQGRRSLHVAVGPGYLAGTAASPTGHGAASGSRGALYDVHGDVSSGPMEGDSSEGLVELSEASASGPSANGHRALSEDRPLLPRPQSTSLTAPPSALPDGSVRQATPMSSMDPRVFSSPHAAGQGLRQGPAQARPTDAQDSQPSRPLPRPPPPGLRKALLRARAEDALRVRQAPAGISPQLGAADLYPSASAQLQAPPAPSLATPRDLKLAGGYSTTHDEGTGQGTGSDEQQLEGHQRSAPSADGLHCGPGLSRNPSYTSMTSDL